MNSPAPITFYCSHCGTKLLVPFESAGESGPCPQCAEVITSPLVSSVPRTAAPGPVSPGGLPQGLTPPAVQQAADWHRDFELPPMGAIPPDPMPLDSGRAAAGPGAYPGGYPQPSPRSRGVPSARRRQAVSASGFPSEPDPSRFDEPTPSRSFPVALVTLLLVVLGGSGYLSWRMGFWGPSEPVSLVDRGEQPSTTAKAEPLPVVKAADHPVASLGADPAPVESPSSAIEPAPVIRAEPAVPPPGPQPLASLAATPKPVPTAELPRISEPRLAVAPPEPVRSAPVGPSAAVAGQAGRSAPGGVADQGGEDSSLGRARAAVRQFLEASTWRDRVSLVETEGDPEAVLSAFYQKNPDLPVKDYRLDFFHTDESAAGGVAAHIFFLTFANETDGFPVMVLERKGQFRVDWPLYVEFRERAFQRFVEEMPPTPGRFRVVLQRVTYSESDRDEIPGLDQFLCYKIDPPYPGMTRFAFVDKEKPIGKQMAREISWEADPLAAEVQLKWETFPGGKRYLTVEQLVSTSWVRPTTAKVAQP